MSDPDSGGDGETGSGRGYPEADREVASIAPDELNRRLDADEPVRLLDTRNRTEIEAWRIDAPVRVDIPYVQFQAAEVTDSVAGLVADTPVADDGSDGAAGAPAGPTGGPLVVVCAEGRASAYVAGLLQEAGIEAVNLEGGMRGWARLYEPRVVTERPLVIGYARPSSGCLAYLVVGGGVAAVVDPLRAFADRYREDARERGAELRYAIDTHVHADHVSGVRALVDAGVTGVLPAPAAERGYEGPPVERLADGDRLDVGGVSLEAVHAPGHTIGTTAYHVTAGSDRTGTEELLLTGDALFTARLPRPDLQEGEDGAGAHARQLHRTLTDRFARFDGDVLVAPGHYDPGDGNPTPVRLGTIRERLPAFSMSAEAFVDHVLANLGARPANHERIVALNLGTQTVGDDEAFELELGPNNCAVDAVETSAD